MDNEVKTLATFPSRKSLALTTFISTTLMIVALLFTNAHNSPLDELGCHRDPPGGNYHCHTGSLKGREFSSKEEAERSIASVMSASQDPDFKVTLEDDPAARPAAETEPAAKDLLPPPPEQPTAVVNANMLKVVSWNVKKKEKIDYDRLVNILAEADIAALQGLDLDEKGKGPLHIIGDLWQSRVGSKVCRMWFKNSSQGREKIGILWRQSFVGYVNEAGDIKEKCGEMAVVIPTGKGPGARMIASSLFFSKVQKKMFQLGTVFLDTKPGNPQREVPGLFRPLEKSNWPTIVTGDFKFNTHGMKNWNYKPAIRNQAIRSKKNRGTKYTTQNIWSRNAVIVRALHVNLYDRFSEMSTKNIENTVSTHFPMLAEVALVPEADDKLTSVIIKTKKREAKPAPAPAAKPKRTIEAPPKENFEEPHEDLEAEAGMVDDPGETRTPAAEKSAPKSRNKRKR